MVLPANFETLEDLIKEHMAITKELFEKYGEVTTMCIGYAKDKRIMLPLIFRSNDEKEMILRMVTMVFAVHNVSRYTVGNEAWTLEGPPEEVNAEYKRLQKKGLMIANSPNRVEVLTCIATSRQKSLMMMSRIKADRSIEDIDMGYDFTKSSGRFIELLPPEGISDKAISEMKMFLARAKKIGLKFRFDIEE